MLSNPLHRFSSYHALPATNMMHTAHLPSNHLHANGLDSLAHGSQYALQQLQRQIDVHQNAQVPRTVSGKHRQHPYHGVPGSVRSSSMHGTSSSGPVRRRISRACDQCNQLRTKCDGQNPCAHCVEFSLSCEYIRERKKRGKASRKDLAAAAAAAAQNGRASPADHSSDGRSSSEPRPGNDSSKGGSANGQTEAHLSESSSMGMSDANGSMLNGVAKMMKSGPSRSTSMRSLNSDLAPHHHHQQLMAGHHDDGLVQDSVDSPTDMGLNDYGHMHTYRPTMNGHLMNGGQTVNYGNHSGLPAYADLPYSMQSPQSYSASAQSPGDYRLDESPIPGFAMDSPGPSPGWQSMASPIPQYHMGNPHTFNAPPRYPVLQPLVPHLGNIIPLSLACDLLDLYFASSSSAQMHPMSPYILGYVSRKRSFLHPTKPRVCSPALLASMLWVAAQTSDAACLTAPPAARGRVCQRLLELTVALLKPLIHCSPISDASPNFADTMNGVALGGLGVSLSGSVTTEALNHGEGSFGASGQLDDVVTYIHLATVVSASESKGASLRWWNAAWSLARELKLNRELPLSQQHMNPVHDDVDADGEVDDDLDVPSEISGISEEEREERRRIWWLVYTVDRHLSLCYNKPLFLLDVECDGLLQPMEDALWQAGDFYSGDSSLHITSPNGSARVRTRGPNIECNGHSVFGYFLPLMTILGAIVDLNHARNHPRFGGGFRSAQEWDDHANEITLQLEAYGRSLKVFEARHLSTMNNPHIPSECNNDLMDGMNTSTNHDMISSSNHSVDKSASSISTGSDVQTRIVIAYGTHVMHVLHILLTGKWDPISLLNDNDLWISSQSFIDATSHAVAAAEAIESILEFDPALEFMPFFFGIYLLQGSFLLLLTLDKWESEASASVFKACETIVRAHESCVVTLDTEYQRNFLKVMRSALAQVRDRVPGDFGEHRLRQMEVLSLYRWTGDGTGLAL